MYSLYYSKHVAKHRIINEWSISEEDPRSTGYFQWIVIYDEYVGIKRAKVSRRATCLQDEISEKMTASEAARTASAPASAAVSINDEIVSFLQSWRIYRINLHACAHL